MKNGYQLMPALRAEEYAALEGDIKSRGVLVAVEYDDQGHILDGHNRVEIADRLGIRFKKVIRHFKSEEEKREHVIKLNLARRHLDALRWGLVFKMLLEVKGVVRGKGGDRRSKESTATVAVGQVATELGVPKRTAEHRLRLADTYESLPRSAREQIDEGKKTVSQAKRERCAAIKRADLAKAAEQIADAAFEKNFDVRCCSMSNMLGELKKIDAIITDPPYGREHIPIYGELARLAKDSLAKDGVLAVLTGQSYLPEILAAMTEHMTYRWTMAYLTPGGQSVQLWNRKVNTFWKPVLLLGATGGWIGDVVRSDVNDNDKKFHNWGQSESGMNRLVEAITKPGDLVCDPFLGAGTTGVVCAALSRRFVGCDTDESCVSIAKTRIKATMK